MNRERDTDQILRHWVSEGAERAPEWAVWAALDKVELTNQRPAWRARVAELSQRLTPAVRLLGASAVVLLMVLGYVRFSDQDLGGSRPGSEFSTNDLAAIVVWEDTAPPGWTLDSLITTARDVLTIPVRSMSGADFVARAEVNGYTAGRYTDFSGRDAVFISWATLFDRVEQADAALDAYLFELGSSEGWGLGSGTAVGLGDEGFVLTGETRALMGGDRTGDPVPMQIYIWRSGNLLMAIGGWFDYDPQQLLEVALAMNSRAERALK